MAGFLGNFQGTYDPEKVIVSIKGISVHGFSDGDFISVKFDNDVYQKVTGVDGEVSRIKTSHATGHIEITTMASSKVNDELSNLNPNFTDFAPYPISIADLSGRTQVFSEKSWLKSMPELVMGKEVGEYKWVFDSADLYVKYAGSKNNSVFDAVVDFFS